MSLLDELSAYSRSGIYPMHMPGHKRNKQLMPAVDLFGIDLTEIDGFDSLHAAKGLLRNAMSKAVSLYGSKHTYFLINGSSCGILAAVSACVTRGGRVLMARNCHQSVYNALEIMELNAVYIQPPRDAVFGINGSVSPDNIRRALEENEDISLIIITSPTYEGVISDVKSIAELAHERRIPLLVDEAHGAHLRFMPDAPADSIDAGADIVVHGMHKTLPSPTQTALLHVNGELVDAEKIKRQLTVFQSSSPSYPLMAGLDYCINLLSEKRCELFEKYTERLNLFSRKMKDLKHLKVLLKGGDTAGEHPDIFAYDSGKIVISAANTGINGDELKELLLEKFRIQIEMTAGTYVLAMTSIADTDEGFDRLASALLDIDGGLCEGTIDSPVFIPVPETVIPVHKALAEKTGLVPFNQSAGLVSGEYVYSYPPGIPLIVPGELITEDFINAAEVMKMQSVSLASTSGGMPEMIKVIKHK